MVRRIRLGELLVKAGILDELRLQSALNEQRKWGGRLGKVIVDLGYVEENVITKALSKQLGVPRADLDNAQVPQDILRRMDAPTAQQNGLCPERYDTERKVLTVAMADPTDVQSLDDVGFRTGARVEATIAGESEIARAIDRLFFGRVETSVELGGSDSFAAMGGTETGPFAEFEPGALETETRPAPSSAERFGPITAPPSTTPPAAPRDGLAEKLDAAQKRQNRAIRVMIDMLIEKGVFSEKEFRERLGLNARTKR